MENIYESSYTALLAGLRGIKNECDEAIAHYDLMRNQTSIRDNTQDVYRRIFEMYTYLYKVLNKKIKAAIASASLEIHRGKIKNYDTYLSFYNIFEIPTIMNTFETKKDSIIEFINSTPFENDIDYSQEEKNDYEEYMVVSGGTDKENYLKNVMLIPRFEGIYGDLHSLNKDYNPNTVLQKEGAAIRKSKLEGQVAKGREVEKRLALMQAEQAQKQSRGPLNYAGNYATSLGKTLRSIGETCIGAFCSSPRAAARAAAAPLGSVPNTRRAVRSDRASSQPRQRLTRGGSRRTRKNMKRRGAK